MRARLAAERGSALVTAIVLMSIMLAAGLGTYALVDAQTRESGIQRLRESSFNLGEALLGSQVFILSRGWPLTAQEAYPTCANGSGDRKCPDGGRVIADFGGPDVARGVSWQTRVVDNALDTINGADSQARCTDNRNATPSYYSDERLAEAPSWDANGDCRLWVRATAAVAGRRRTFVGLVRVEQVNEQLPKNAITTGWFRTENHGNKVLVDTKGEAGQAAPVAVRCGGYGPGCADYDRDKGQLSPDTVAYGYPGGTALSPGALDRLRERAQAAGSYWDSSCPSSLSGPLVFVESASCVYQGNAVYNSPGLPGMVVFGSGKLTIRGTVEYFGVVYMANLSGLHDVMLDLGGNSLVSGSVAVDGVGGVSVGDSAMNLRYDPRVFARVVSFANAGIIQNTWREIPPGG